MFTGRCRSPGALRRGFSLVEVLVVTALVALLAGLLLPSLAHARQTARRTVCLSNLRQVHHAFQYYADDHADAVPLGYRAGTKQFNSMIYSATTQRLVLFGVVYRARLMADPRVFFCPAETDPRSRFATAANGWPPGRDGDPAKHTYCGYGARPDVELPDGFEELGGAVLPRLGELARKAIVGDLTATPDRVNTRHRTGINLLHGDGSADWHDRRVFDEYLRRCTGISSEFNDEQTGIWEQLDRGH